MPKLFKSYCKGLTPEQLNREFLKAVEEERIEDVKLLLTSPYLQDYVDIHYDEDEAFRILCRKRNMEILNFFIFDMNIERTEFIVEHLETARGWYKHYGEEKKVFFIDQVNQALEKRLLKDELGITLSTEDKSKIKKAKL